MLILTALVAGGIGAIVYHHFQQQDLKKQAAEHHQRLLALEGHVVTKPSDAKVQ